MCKVSVVIPVYNTERYLERCITSLLNQTLKEIELIFVNDGSTDNSLEILNKYKEKDKRIKIINKKNEGVSLARNKGIEICNGDYIAFVDSDDFVEKNFLERLYNNAIENVSDIVISKIIYWNDSSGILRESNVTYGNKVLRGIDGVRDFLLKRNVENYPWNKLYKRKLFTDNNIEYPIGKYYEDAHTTYKLLYSADRISYCEDAKYFYVQRMGSIINQSFSAKNMDYIDALSCIKVFLEDKDIFNLLEEEYYNYYGQVHASELRKLIKDKKYIEKSKYRQFEKKILDNIMIAKNKLIRNKFLRIRYKLFIIYVCSINIRKKTYRK